VRFFVRSYAILNTKFIIYEILCFYLNGERNIKLCQAVYVSVRTILAISTSDWRTLPRTETLYFLAATLHFDWMVKEYKAVSSGVRVSQHLFLCETTLFLCETNPVSKWNNTVSMWNSPVSFVDSPVSLWTILFLCGQLPFLFRLDRIVSVWTALFLFIPEEVSSPHSDFFSEKIDYLSSWIAHFSCICLKNFFLCFSVM